MFNLGFGSQQLFKTKQKKSAITLEKQKQEQGYTGPCWNQSPHS